MMAHGADTLPSAQVRLPLCAGNQYPMAMPELLREWTVADVHALPDDGNRYEVIDGELFVTPAPAWKHQAAVHRLSIALDAYVGRLRLGYVLATPADVVFSPKRLVQPDIFVVPPAAGRRPERFEDVRELLLAVEILSPTTARADRVRKRSLFREERTPEFWIVDLDSRVIERSTPADQRIEVISERMIWQPAGATEPFELDLEWYFQAVLER